MADIRREEKEEKRQRKAETNQKKADNLARNASDVLDIKEKPFRPKRKSNGRTIRSSTVYSKKACRFNKYIVALTTQTFEEAENKIQKLPTFRGHLQQENEEFMIRLRNAFVDFSEREDANVRSMFENDNPKIRERTLWEMFQLVPSNPANEVLPSAVAHKADKIQYLQELRN